VFRLLIGLALLPSSALMLAAAARAMGFLASRAPSSYPFLAGLCLTACYWFFERYILEGESGPGFWFTALAKRGYIFGHEFTHALAAWSAGGKVLDFKVGESGGHVDLSHSNAFIALAPYCVPIYTLFVVLGYRLWVWFKPQSGGYLVFLILMGATLSFHLLKTFDCLWDRRQPDLAAAGGAVFSLSWILLMNGLIILILLKILFPKIVILGPDLIDVGRRTVIFWKGVGRFLKPLSTPFVKQLAR
jgi:hypothetical protein